MKTKISTLCGLATLTGAVISFTPQVQAQNAVAPALGGRLSVVELRDTTLADALELIYRAAGNPSHIIDPSANNVPISSVTLNNISWEAAVRNLATLNNYKVSRNGSGAYVVEPRNPVPVGDEGEGALPFGPASPFAPGRVPSNPFRNRTRTQALPSIRTFANSQTRPSRGGRGGGASNEGKRYQVLVMQHVYAGGIARLFGAPILETERFLNPDLRQNKLTYTRVSFGASTSGSTGGGGGGDLGGGGGGDLGGGGGDLGGGDLGGGGGDLGGGGGDLGGGGLGF